MLFFCDTIDADMIVYELSSVFIYKALYFEWMGRPMRL